MYGGIFTDRPFEFNMKCIAISLFLSVGYWLVPAKNIIVLITILIMSYLAISWYDYLYDCTPRMKSGQATPRSIFKPQERDPSETGHPAEYTYLRIVYGFHLLIIAPLVLYCGSVGYMKTSAEGGVNKFMFATLISVGILATLYHGFRLISPREVTSTSGFSASATASPSGVGYVPFINATYSG